MARDEELLGPGPPIPAAHGLRLVASRPATRPFASQAGARRACSAPGQSFSGAATRAEAVAQAPYSGARPDVHLLSATAVAPVHRANIPAELMQEGPSSEARGTSPGASPGWDRQLMAAAGRTVFIDENEGTALGPFVKLFRVAEAPVVGRLGEKALHQVDS